MGYLTENEEREARKYMEHAAKVALGATCQRSRCGSVIVKEGEIIGEGFNSPPGDVEGQRRCACSKEIYHRKVTDKTCCVHAEQRAILDALKRNPDKIGGSRLYFIRLDAQGNLGRAGKPYCTICSKMALDAGIAEFVLWHGEGICAYGTERYNTLSFQYLE